VGLCLGRGPEMVAAMVGAWLAGRRTCRWTGSTRRAAGFMLADSGAVVVVTRGGLPAGVAAGVPVADLGDPRVAAAVAARCRWRGGGRRGGWRT